ncbi:MAG: hypothetical protein ACQEVA_06945 [Myxococcota bacterium]
MSTPDNNQWSQGPQQSSPGPRPGGHNYGRIASFNDVFNNLDFASSLVFKPGVIVYYLAHGLIGGGIYFGLIFGLMATMGVWSDIQDPGAMNTEPEFGALFVVGLIGILIYAFVWGALGTGPIASIRNAARGNFEAVESIGTTFKQGLRAGLLAIPVLFLTYFSTLVGFLLLIIPGFIVAFLLTPAVYLVVTGQAGTLEAFGQSFNLVKKHTGAIGALWVALVGGYMLLFGVNFCLGMIPIVGALISIPIQLAGYAFFFVVYISTMLTIDSAENGWTPGSAHDGIEQVFE